MSGTGLVVLLVVLVVTTAAGLVLRARSGAVRRSAPAGPTGPGWELAGVDPAGRRALLLQLSSPVCTPCRQTAVLLAGLAADDPGLAHVEIDVADRVDVARALGVMRTPTTVVFDGRGAELLRVAGVPRTGELVAALPAPDGPGPAAPAL
ncbi:thioredoxin [Pseudonocardia sp. Ae168_Ps1]|uniref:thioredoxin family protein n=1 Tax=unclassified Pseudonocardia TaxID=2619320 RepID=UPI00094AB80E|nr:MULTISPECIES: thioredoxin family protein [unclassified Pseudonocardia]OLL75331.1 thioredoxin [Pseudonocardia sp. Ae150A_Ps1]OLL81326.1 thioredoxin [Pseudonocardia sp. Ae168_Ps1]OLL84561.1 thioredoxin [Pseudonocardia sp. Ae263_Ps1]OLL95420.1 thioredoxin [Pseudonocardia sp. Ae356_Ps1]